MRTNSFLAIPVFVYASLYLCIYPSEKRIVALFGAYLAQYLNDYKVEQLDTFLFNYSYEINLEFDSKGNVIPFNNGKGSHAHIWQKDSSDGKLKRKSHDKKNSFPIESKYNSLISKIETFNKQKKK